MSASAKHVWIQGRLDGLESRASVEQGDQEQQEQAEDRLPDEDAMRYPGHDDPRDTVDPDPSSADA